MNTTDIFDTADLVNAEPFDPFDLVFSRSSAILPDSADEDTVIRLTQSLYEACPMELTELMFFTAFELMARSACTETPVAELRYLIVNAIEPVTDYDVFEASRKANCVGKLLDQIEAECALTVSIENANGILHAVHKSWAQIDEALAQPAFSASQQMTLDVLHETMAQYARYAGADSKPERCSSRSGF